MDWRAVARYLVQNQILVEGILNDRGTSDGVMFGVRLLFIILRYFAGE